MKISKFRLEQDVEIFNSVFTFLSPDGKDNEDSATFMSLTLVNCYYHITEKHATDILQSPDKINSLEELNKDLLAIEKWYDLFKNDRKKLKEEIDVLQDTYTELYGEKKVQDKQNNIWSEDDDIVENDIEVKKVENIIKPGQQPKNIAEDMDLDEIYEENKKDEPITIFGIDILYLIIISCILPVLPIYWAFFKGDKKMQEQKYKKTNQKNKDKRMK